MSKYQVGDKVFVNDFAAPNGAMTRYMLEEFGGMVATIRRVISPLGRHTTYQITEDPVGFEFTENDLSPLESSLVSLPENTMTQRIEIPVPGGHLVAETTGGADYPAIHVFFVASGDEVEHGLCFAEVCATEKPDEIRVGTYFRDCDEVKEITEYPMWKKEEDDV